MEPIDAACEPLLSAARAAALSAHCPYSRFRVGAAVRASGRVFTGGNIENASYGLTVCAERCAIFRAVGEGVRAIDAVAVSCIDAVGGPPGARMPCGACRQVLAEFMGPEGTVIVDGVGVFRLSELLPTPFALRADP